MGPRHVGVVGLFRLSALPHGAVVGDAPGERKRGPGARVWPQPLGKPPELCYTLLPERGSENFHKGWAMDYFFFFAGLFCTIAALLVIKKTSPNEH